MFFFRKLIFIVFFRELFVIVQSARARGSAVCNQTFDLTVCRNNAICSINERVDEFSKVAFLRVQNNVREVHFTNTSENQSDYRFVLLVDNIRLITTPTIIHLKTCDPADILEQYTRTSLTPLRNYASQTYEILEKRVPTFIDHYDIHLTSCVHQTNGSETGHHLNCNEQAIEFLNIHSTYKQLLLNMTYISLEGNRIAIINKTNSNLFLWSRFLVKLNLDRNPIHVIECDTFLRSRYFRFIETDIDDVNIDLRCLIDFNRNIQHVRTKSGSLWNRCGHIESINRTHIIRIDNMTEILPLSYYMGNKCLNQTWCKVDHKIEGRLIVRDEDFENVSSLRQLEVPFVRNIIYLKFLRKAQIFDFKFGYRLPQFMIFRNCGLDWDVYYTANYIPYVANDVKKLYVVRESRTYVNFKECLSDFCAANESGATSLNCSRYDIYKMAAYVTDPSCLDRVTALHISHSKIAYWTPTTVPVFKNVIYINMVHVKITAKNFNVDTFSTSFPQVRYVDALGFYNNDISDVFRKSRSLVTLRFSSWPPTFSFNLWTSVHTFKNKQIDTIWPHPNVNVCDVNLSLKQRDFRPDILVPVHEPFCKLTLNNDSVTFTSVITTLDPSTTDLWELQSTHSGSTLDYSESTIGHLRTTPEPISSRIVNNSDLVELSTKQIDPTPPNNFETSTNHVEKIDSTLSSNFETSTHHIEKAFSTLHSDLVELSTKQIDPTLPSNLETSSSHIEKVYSTLPSNFETSTSHIEKVFSTLHSDLVELSTKQIDQTLPSNLETSSSHIKIVYSTLPSTIVEQDDFVEKSTQQIEPIFNDVDIDISRNETGTTIITPLIQDETEDLSIDVNTATSDKEIGQVGSSVSSNLIKISVAIVILIFFLIMIFYLKTYI